MTVLNNAQEFTLAKDAADYIEAKGKVERVAPSMMVHLVEAHRASTDGDPVFIIGDDGDDIATRAITYADFKAWGDGTFKAEQVTALKARIRSATPRITKTLEAMAKNAEIAKAAKTATDEGDIAKGNVAKVNHDNDKKIVEAAMRCMERAIFAAIAVIENTDRAPYKTLHLPRGSKSAMYTGKTKSGKEVSRVVSSSMQASELRAKLTEWNMTDEERAAAAKAKPDTRTEEQRAPHGNVTETEKTLNGIRATTGGDAQILDAALSVLASFDNDNAPKGDVRDRVLALASAALNAVTMEQVAAWEKKNAAKDDNAA